MKTLADYLYYEDYAGKLYCGDCLEIMPLLEKESVDMILADLPYGTTQCKWDSVLDLNFVWIDYDHVRKPNTAVLLTSQQPFTTKLIMSRFNLFRYEWIWEKTHATGYLDAKKKPMRAHESILCFYKEQPTYNPIKTTGHERKVSLASHKTKCLNNQAEIYGKNKNFIDYDSTERYPRSVIKFKLDKQGEGFHPTQKPVELMKYLIQTYTNKGDLVLDNTCGSGTTLVACKQMGRRYIGIEISEKYCEIAKRRLENTDEQFELEFK